MTHPGPALGGARAVVMGLGGFGGGAGAARFLCAAGARVTVTDLRPEEELSDGLALLRELPVELVLGRHREEDFRTADLVVANPAVPPSNALLELARASGARVVSAEELFLERTAARVACVTGTQGKSSTASMIAQLLAAAGLDARLGGNIGGSLLPEVDRLGRETVAVLELSSYQLEALSSADHGGRAELVAVTNVLSDHVERHGTRAAYAAAKARVLELLGAGGTALLPSPSPFAGLLEPDPAEALRARVARVVRVGPDAELRTEAGRFRLGDEDLGSVADLRLPGRFQVANALVALGAARLLGAPAERLAAAVGTLGGLPHRMEDLGRVRGHRVFDNGVSTTPDSTAAALESVEGRCVLLCGGLAKRDLPLAPLVEAARGRVRLAVTFGRAARDLAAALAAADVPAREAADVSDAVRVALEEAREDEATLLPPACASFDAYPNFQARAREFRATLSALV